MSTTICWEEGLTCEGCHQPIKLGEEMLYKRHLGCARQRADAQRQDSGGTADILTVVREKLARGGRITLTAPQLRALAGCACQAPGFIPVRKPDAGTRQKWYGTLAGWSAARVQAGLSAPEIAGLYLDYLDTGRVPPLRAADLATLLEVATGEVATGEVMPSDVLA